MNERINRFAPNYYFMFLTKTDEIVKCYTLTAKLVFNIRTETNEFIIDSLTSDSFHQPDENP